jgi:uncharacterized protein (DUF2147 family)
MIGRRAAILMLAAALLTPAPARAADPSGHWLTQDGDATIRIGRCGGALCGRIVALREPRDPETGRTKTDEHNRNDSLRSRPLIGVSIVVGMQPSARPGQWTGQVYNPEDGGTYPAKLILLNPRSLRIEGCIVPEVFCDGQTWTRVR